jgi:hypothetical protein
MYMVAVTGPPFPSTRASRRSMRTLPPRAPSQDRHKAQFHKAQVWVLDLPPLFLLHHFCSAPYLPSPPWHMNLPRSVWGLSWSGTLGFSSVFARFPRGVLFSANKTSTTAICAPPSCRVPSSSCCSHSESVMWAHSLCGVGLWPPNLNCTLINSKSWRLLPLPLLLMPNNANAVMACFRDCNFTLNNRIETRFLREIGGAATTPSEETITLSLVARQRQNSAPILSKEQKR